MPAILVTVLGYLAINPLFIDPRGVLQLASRERLVGMVAYLFTSAIIIGFGQAMRRAQARATQRREILRVTLQSIGDAVITTDNAGRIASLNAVAEAVTGWDAKDAIGLQFCRPESTAQNLCVIGPLFISTLTRFNSFNNNAEFDPIDIGLIPNAHE